MITLKKELLFKLNITWFICTICLRGLCTLSMLRSGKTRHDLCVKEWNWGFFLSALITSLIFAAPLVGLLFLKRNFVKQSPYRGLSACEESAYLHEPAEWSQLPQEWSPDKDDPGDMDSTPPRLRPAVSSWLATINNLTAFFFYVTFSALPSKSRWQKERNGLVFLLPQEQKLVSADPTWGWGKQQPNGAVMVPDYTWAQNWMEQEEILWELTACLNQSIF